MLRFALFACLLVAIQGRNLPGLSRRPSQIFPNGRIVGGQQTTIDAVPWQVALEDSGYLFCGGSIISANYVLTAAHCTDGSSARSINVRYGTDKLQAGGTTVAVSKIAQNPGFTQQNLDYDVSVLALSKAISLSNSARAVTLRDAEASQGETATVSGWGTTSEGGGSLPSVLRKVDVPVVSRSSCNSAYGGDITARMICAGEAGKDSCQGDSGGAITIGGKQVGIVSWGYGCAEQGYPGVYSNVAALKSYINNNSNGEATWG